jgi:hypothetical protein
LKPNVVEGKHSDICAINGKYYRLIMNTGSLVDCEIYEKSWDCITTVSCTNVEIHDEVKLNSNHCMTNISFGAAEYFDAK